MIKKLLAFNRYILVFITLAFTFLVFGCVSFNDTEDITLSQDSVELEIGEDVQITATLKIDINGQVTWTADNPSIATVDNGLIKGVSVGETFITVSFGDLSVKVNVSVVAATTVTTITLNKVNLELLVGEDEVLTATVSPTTTENLTWTSNKPDIATVVDGKVTGIKEGVAEITVTLGNASTKVNVTVINPTTENLSLAFDNSNYVNARMRMKVIIAIMGESLITETIMNADGNNYYSYSKGLGFESEEFVTLIDNTIYSASRMKIFDEWTEWEIMILEDDSDYRIEFSSFLADDFVFVDGYFVLKEEKYAEYMEIVELDEEFTEIYDSFIFKLQLQGGLLSNAIIEVDVIEDDVTSSMVLELEISNIGTTEVIIHNDLLEDFANYNNQD